MSIRLIKPPTAYPIHYSHILPYGIGILAGHLKKHKKIAMLVDLHEQIWSSKNSSQIFSIQTFLKQAFNDCVKEQKYIGLSHPKHEELARILYDMSSVSDENIIGISVYSGLEIIPTLLLVEILQKKSKALVVLGGPYITMHADELMQRYSFLNYLIRGDGQLPLEKLAHAIDNHATYEDIPSLVWRNNGDVIKNDIAHTEIRHQAFPDYGSLLWTDYRSDHGPLIMQMYSMSRGCVNRCHFCAFAINNDNVQIKPIEKIVEDLRKLVHTYEVKSVFFADVNITQIPKFIEKLCIALEDNPINVLWGGMAESYQIENDLLQKMYKAGCRFLAWGMESASDSLRNFMGKRDTASHFERVIRSAAKIGIKNKLYLIFEYPYETYKDLKQTAHFLKRNAPFIASVRIQPFYLPRTSSLFQNSNAFQIEACATEKSFIFHDYDCKEKKPSSRANQLKRKYWQRKLICMKVAYIDAKKTPHAAKKIFTTYSLSLFLTVVDCLNFYLKWRLISSKRYKHYEKLLFQEGLYDEHQF